MLGIQDTGFRAHDRVVTAQAAALEAEQRRLEAQFAPMFLIADWDQSVANPKRQQGMMKGYRVFEKELQELNPSLRIIPHGGNSTKALVFAGNEKLFPCERIMPEFSIMHAQKEEKPIIHTGPITLDAPAFEEVTRVWREISRGWRTVLVKLMVSGHLSAPQVEKRFGVVDRATWARLLGKQKIERSLF